MWHKRGGTTSLQEPVAANSAATSVVSATTAPLTPPTDTSVWQVVVEPDDPTKGPADALVTIVAFSDFQAPPAKRAARTMDELLAAYPNELRVVWKDDPLPFNPRAKPAEFPCLTCARTMHRLLELEQEYSEQLRIVFRHTAEPARAASFLAGQAVQQVFAQAGESAFWTFHNRLLEHQGAPDALAAASLESLARDMPLDVQRFKVGLKSPEISDIVRRDSDAARAANLASPSFTINGYYLTGSPDPAEFRRAIQHALVDLGGVRP